MYKLTDTLWLGNYHSAKNVAELVTCGIQRVVSVIDKKVPDALTDAYREKGIKHEFLQVRDKPSEDIAPHAQKFRQIMTDEPLVTLVHCRGCISRSPTIAIDFLMHSEKMTLDEALEHVKRVRPIIDPNTGFFSYLVSQDGPQSTEEESESGDPGFVFE